MGFCTQMALPDPFHVGFVANVWDRSNYGHIEFALETLLDDLHVEHAQNHNGIRAKAPRSLLQKSAASFSCNFSNELRSSSNSSVSTGHQRIPWASLFESAMASAAGFATACDGVTNLYFFGLFNPRNDVAYIPCFNFFGRRLFDQVDSNLVRFILLARNHELHLHHFDAAVNHFKRGFDTTEWIVVTVKNQGL